MNPGGGEPPSTGATTPVIAVIGNPNTGKSTLFNALTGLRQKTANYPGVTVERHTGSLTLNGTEVTLVDLPGAYSLAAHSPDEMVALDVLLGHAADLPRPRAVLAVLDATNLRRNLFLLTQLAELELPVVVALNLSDLAVRRGISLDVAALSDLLKMPVVQVAAASGQGVEALRQAMARSLSANPAQPLAALPAAQRAAEGLWSRLQGEGSTMTAFEILRALIDADGAAERRFMAAHGERHGPELQQLRARLGAAESLAAQEARTRYALINDIVRRTEHRAATTPGLGHLLDQSPGVGLAALSAGDGHGVPGRVFLGHARDGLHGRLDLPVGRSGA
jgi:ferrous iron transport protein B